jgi:hypothetical protein
MHVSVRRATDVHGKGKKILKSTDFWVCVFWREAEISEEHINSVFRVDEEAKQGTCRSKR